VQLAGIAFGNLTQHEYAEVTPALGENLEIAEIARMLEEGLEIAEQLGDPRLIADFYRYLGRVALYQEHYPQAEQHIEQGLKFSEERGDLEGIPISYMYLAEAAAAQKDFAKARDYFRHELEIDFHVGSRRWQTDTIVKIVRVLIKYGDKLRATELLT